MDGVAYDLFVGHKTGHQKNRSKKKKHKKSEPKRCQCENENLYVIDDDWQKIPAIKSRLKCSYDNERCRYVRLIYICLIIVWIAIVLILRMYCTDLLGIFILLIPVVCFIIGYCNCDVITKEVEDNIFATNYTGLGLLFVVPLLSWISRNYCGDRKWLIAILITGIILILLSLVDFWINVKWIYIMKHVTSGLQTMTIAIVIFVIYTFYLTGPETIAGLYT